MNEEASEIHPGRHACSYLMEFNFQDTAPAPKTQSLLLRLICAFRAGNSASLMATTRFVLFSAFRASPETSLLGGSAGQDVAIGPEDGGDPSRRPSLLSLRTQEQARFCVLRPFFALFLT